ncbi:N-acetylneuraminate lyase [Clostridiales bacterium COT073_COT-073]|nr:N-acetylneuraminate lyase [Clostridiales bacterium COT073_COT-073]
MSEKQFKGIVPAFYACYDQEGRINKEMVRKFTRHLINAGVDGLYVGGSSGECIYQNIEARKAVLEEVMKEADNEIFIIAHVACNGVEDSKELARHAESLRVDAIAAIPPIYFKVGDEGVAKYWNDISTAAPNTDFIIYNIPQLTGVTLNRNILNRMLKNDKVVGVKNSSMATFDIYDYIEGSDGKLFVFNGPDEQLISGLAMGAVGGIGGTYGLMPELFIKLYHLFNENKITAARALQYEINNIISMACAGQGSMYAIIKAALNKKYGFNFNGVKAPLINKADSDDELVDNIVEELNQLYKKYEI